MNTQNPFPGMNPFMEQTWPDVHLRLISYILESLGTELPDDLLAKGELQVDVLGGDAKNYRPDAAILDERWKHGLPPVWTPDMDTKTITVTEPVLLEEEEVKHRWVEILSDQGNLITVIEVLSPANKNRQRDAYMAKRRDYLDAGVNVVEIDLLRQGARTVNVEGIRYDNHFKNLGAHYTICVTRAAIPGRREVYPCPLRERLPTIRIPLRITDPDVPLDIQSLIDRAYTTGRYWKLDHTSELTPPLTADDAAWANECLKVVGI